MHEVSTSRRDVMCALAIAPAVIATTGAASAATGLACTPIAEASGWDAAMQAYLRAEAEYRAYIPIHDKAFADYNAQKPSVEAIGIDRLSFGGKDVEFIAHGLDLDREWQSFLKGEGRWWWGDKAKSRMRGENDRIQAYRDERERVAFVTGVDEASVKVGQLSDAASDLEDVLIAMPAPHWEAVLWKQERLFGDLDRGGGSTTAWTVNYVKPFFDDIHRLAGRA